MHLVLSEPTQRAIVLAIAARAVAEVSHDRRVGSGRIAYQYLGSRYCVCEQAVRGCYATLPTTSPLRRAA